VSVFISPERRHLLELHRLLSFEAVWKQQADWFEAPNERRGGWSGVGRLGLNLPEGGEFGVFLKRQQNHQRRTFRHPFTGEPTFSCEFKMMRYLQKHGVPAPKPVFYGEQVVDGHHQATLMTEELVDYRPLEDITETLFANGRPSLKEQNRVIRGVAATVRMLHGARIQHRSLYPKHLFVNTAQAGDPDVVVIDLEKSRIKLFPAIRALYDLATLNRHARYWSASRRLYFFMQYYGIERLGLWHKLMCRLIIRRSTRRKDRR
jgi:hypothetical protein